MKGKQNASILLGGHCGAVGEGPYLVLATGRMGAGRIHIKCFQAIHQATLEHAIQRSIDLSWRTEALPAQQIKQGISTQGSPHILEHEEHGLLVAGCW